MARATASRQQDMANKPLRCARAGVPDVMRWRRSAGSGMPGAGLFALTDGAYRPVAPGVSGRRPAAAEPFAMDLDPADLLPEPTAKNQRDRHVPGHVRFGRGTNR